MEILRLEGPETVESPPVVHVLALPLEGQRRYAGEVTRVEGDQVTLTRGESRRPDRPAFAARRAEPLFLRVLDGPEAGWTAGIVPPLARTGPVVLAEAPPAGLAPGTRVEIAEFADLDAVLGATWRLDAGSGADEIWRYVNASGSWHRVFPGTSEAPKLLPADVFAFVLHQPGVRLLSQTGRAAAGPLRVPVGGTLALVAAEGEPTEADEAALAASLFDALDLPDGAEVVLHPGVSLVPLSGATPASFLLLAPTP